MTRLPPQSNSAFFPALLAVLSHELGSPLAAIRGAATTLIDYRQRLPDERVEGFLQSIDRQTDRLNRLHEALVLLAQIETGTLYLDPEPLDLRTVILRSLEDLPVVYQPGSYVIEGADVQVLADSVYLRRAFTLLVQHLCDRAPALTVIRLEAIQMHATAHLVVDDPDLADPRARLDQVIRSADPTRSKQAVVWLRLALSRAFIEVQGGQWTWAGAGARDQSGLIITLPLIQSQPMPGGE